MNILTPSFYARPTYIVASELLGKVIVRNINGNILSGRIIETEAYDHTDEACHAFRGKTSRNAPLFGPVGHAYVYFNYGLHYCFNAVAYDHIAGGVLIRALQPLEGKEYMIINRNTQYNLMNGPARITQALFIDRKFNECNLTQPSDLYIATDNYIPSSIHASTRVGISKNRKLKWRFT